MKKRTIEKMLQETPLSEMIACTPADRKGNFKTALSIEYQYPKEMSSSNIPEDKRKELEDLFQRNPKKAMEEIIRYRFLDSEITGYYDGAASLVLPTKYHRIYQRSISFETKGYRVYFNDFAIPVFKSTILKLSERSKQDSFQFIKGKLEAGESHNLHLSITEPFQSTRSRMCMLLGSKDHLEVNPENTLCYYTNLLQDGTLEEGDLENILELIEIFAEKYGKFCEVKSIENGLAGYNMGSLKVTGADSVPAVAQKIYSLRKKEE